MFTDNRQTLYPGSSCFGKADLSYMSTHKLPYKVRLSPESTEYHSSAQEKNIVCEHNLRTLERKKPFCAHVCIKVAAQDRILLIVQQMQGQQNLVMRHESQIHAW